MPEHFGSLQLKVFTSDLQEHQNMTFYADPGMSYDSAALLILASQFVEHLKETFPGNEFRLVHKGRNHFNVIPVEVQTA